MSFAMVELFYPQMTLMTQIFLGVCCTRKLALPQQKRSKREIKVADVHPVHYVRSWKRKAWPPWVSFRKIRNFFEVMFNSMQVRYLSGHLESSERLWKGLLGFAFFLMCSTLYTVVQQRQYAFYCVPKQLFVEAP